MTGGNAPLSRPVVLAVSEPIKVDIWSDIACPWCYIGKRRFEAAAAAFDGSDPDRGVALEYHSFELAPDTPVDLEGSEEDYLALHKGLGGDQVREMLARVTGIAASVGLDYDFDALHHTNTVKAHQLLHFAKAHGAQLEVAERLFRAYFVEGGHLGRIEELADIAAEAGLDRAEALRALEQDSYLEDVRADQAQAAAYGIQGVPFYVIDGRYGVSGAQETETFLRVLEQVWSERTPA